ncbi:scavenger receptor class B member 1-like [Tropilaelaps mercedesae]|uniref:Scavenger receptor class B member 1 n=1 Tax=Tropilaelaps mercedesae TaxID=418985 RepID=A0A1V9XVL0_9ACAR|nr:scavenger receptor class B member 1-like [Tropilaelaps mercedesae]
MKLTGGKRRPTALLEYVGMGFTAGRTAGIICVMLGACLVVLGAAVLVNFTATFRFILGKKVVLAPTSQGFPIWRDVSQHLDTRVAWYFFNLTNGKEFLDGKKPVLKEVGPFWFRTTISKKNIHFSDNKTVTFEEHRSFQFDLINSVLPYDTRITMINVPVMTALQKLMGLSRVTRLLADSAILSLIGDQNLLTNYTVAELTYEGQYNKLVAISKIKEGVMEAISALSSEDDKKGKFGFAVDKNETHPAIFNMYTGASGVMDLNRIHSVNNQHVLSIWPTQDMHENNACNIVDGTFGYLRPPMNESNEQKVYIPDMCRAVTLHYEKDVSFHGIRLRRFTLGKENFYNRKQEPKNACYDEQFREPSGVSEVGPCKQGAPVLMSMPHFMYANPKFSKMVEGMNPNVEQHSFIMDHEPTTGMTVSVRGRLQANFRVIPLDMMEGGNIPNALMPLFWQEMYVEAGPGLVAFLHKVTGYPSLAKIALIIVLLIGFIVSIIGAGFLIK